MKREWDETILLTTEDLKGLFWRHFTSIRKTACLSGIVVLLFFSAQSPKYVAESTFQQNARQQNSDFDMRKVVQQYFSAPAENSGVSLLQSRELIKQTISDLGIQIEVKEHGRLVSALLNIGKNLKLFFGKNPEDLDPFLFKKVQFSSEKEKQFYLKPLQEDTFICLNEKKEILGMGKLGQPFSFSDLEFTLVHMPKNVKYNSCYSVSVAPWQKKVEWFQKAFDVRGSKIDGNLLKLSFLSPDRHLGARLLNQHMRNYQNYLRSENEEMCQHQIDYLEKRQEELTASLDKALVDHVSYLKENIRQEGYLGLSEEVEGLSTPKNAYLNRLLEIDLEMERLPMERGEESGKQIQVQPLLLEVEDVDTKVNQTHLLLNAVEKGEDLSLQDPKSFVGMLVKQFYIGAEKARGSALAHNLKTYLNQLQQKKQILLEDLELKQKGHADFSGWTLESCKHLLGQWTTERDGVQAQLREMIFLRDLLTLPEFELSSIGTVFEDSITNELLKQTSLIALQLKDDQNRTARDYERLQETLGVHKQFLSQHLFETIELLKLRGKLLGDKIRGLRAATLDLLQAEKKLLTQKIEGFQAKMQSLPEKWRKENLLSLRKELGMRMVEGMSQLAESKNIGQHLYQVSSKPIDAAIPPLNPKPLHGLLFALLAALFGGGCYFGYLLCEMLWKGVPLSLSQLKLLGLPTAGYLSSSDQDFETLRHLAAFVSSQKITPVCIALIGNPSVDYSQSLAELLFVQGKKVIVVDTVFNQMTDQLGLFQYLNREIFELPIRKNSHCDSLAWGGITRYGTELLSTPQFSNVLEQLKSSYTVLLIRSRARIGSAEAAALFSLVDACIATVTEEKKEELSPLIAWGVRERECRCAFVVEKTSLKV